MKPIIRLCYYWMYLFLASTGLCQEYFGHRITDFTAVSGTIYAVDDRHLFVKNFNYVDSGADANFYAEGPTKTKQVIQPFKPVNPSRTTDILLRLPFSLKLVSKISVLNSKMEVYGTATFPGNFKVPSPRVLAEFSNSEHGLRSGNVTILDYKTIRIPNLHYDGRAPAATFWVGKGTKPHGGGHKIPNERCLSLLMAYTGQTIVLRLPEGLTIKDFDWLSVWRTDIQINFGHVMIPKDHLDDIPPALGQNDDLPPMTSSSPTAAGSIFTLLSSILILLSTFFRHLFL